MRGILFTIGASLIAITFGAPEGLPVHSGSAKSALAYFAYWFVIPFEEWGGRYVAAAIGLAMILASLLLPYRKNPDPRERQRLGLRRRR
jgi:hypothetical protein